MELILNFLCHAQSVCLPSFLAAYVSVWARRTQLLYKLETLNLVWSLLFIIYSWLPYNLQYCTSLRVYSISSEITPAVSINAIAHKKRRRRISDKIRPLMHGNCLTKYSMRFSNSHSQLSAENYQSLVNKTNAFGWAYQSEQNTH